MKMIIKIAFKSIVLLFIFSCSTPYQPLGILGGYSSEKLHNKSYRVSFTGNQHTKVKTVNDNLFKRCAELTLENGFPYFYIYEDSSYIDIISLVRGPDLDNLIIDGQQSESGMSIQNGNSSQLIGNISDPSIDFNKRLKQLNNEDTMTKIIGIFKIKFSYKILNGYENSSYSAKNILNSFE